MRKKAQQPAGTTATSMRDNINQVSEVAKNLQTQLDSFEAKQKAESDQKKQDAAKAAQEAAKQPPTAPSTPQAPTAPSYAAADDQSADDIWNDIKNSIGKLYSLIADSKDKEEGNSVAGVRGSRTIHDLSARGSEEKEKIDKDKKDENGILEKDILHGGAGDDVPDEKLNKKQLEMGTEVELEHTNSEDVAREIARDHLGEELKDGKDKDEQEYYTKLKTIHEDKCKDIAPEILDLSRIK